MAKDSLKLNLDGREIGVRFTLGAIEDFCEEYGVDFQEFEKAMNQPKAIRSLLYYCAKEAGVEVTLDELRGLELTELAKFTALVKGKSGKQGNA